MTIFDWLQDAMIRLRDAGADSPRRDCLVLIEDLLGKDRAWVLAHHEYVLNHAHTRKLESRLKRRIDREPLAYIRGKAWFYGRFFEVNPDVLIPRPESESFIELLKNLQPKQIFDIGTGSGCLAITAKLELPNADVIATDTDQKALSIAKENAMKHNATIGFIKTDLLQGLENFDFSKATLVANLPYVPKDNISSPEITREPAKALFSGKDGMDHYRNFWQQIKKLRNKPKYILTESLENQHKDVEKFALSCGYKLEKSEVLVQLFSSSLFSGNSL